MNRLHLLDLPADRMEGEVVAVFFFEDERPLRGPAALLDWRLNGRLTELLLQGEARGRCGEKLLFRNNGKFSAGWALFVGGGLRSELDGEACARLVRTALTACGEAGFFRIALSLPFLGRDRREPVRKAVSEVLESLDVGLQCFLSLDVPEMSRRRDE